jgi:tetratricopeptide (TPR) repeat protein
MVTAFVAMASSSAFPQSSGPGLKIQELIQQGNIPAAEQFLSEALKQYPRDASLYDLDGVIKAQQGDYARAEASFRTAIELAPSFEHAYLNLGHLYQEWKPFHPTSRDKAIRIYAELLKFDPHNAEANYQSALLLMENGSYAESLRHLANLPAGAQDRTQALLLRCGDEASLGNERLAQETAGRMLQGPDLAEADVMTLLPLLARQKNAVLEITLLEGLEQRHLAGVDSLTRLGLLYKGQGRLDDARKTLDQAARISLSSAPLLLDLARVAFDQHDYTGALGYLAHARDLEPNNASIYFFWGMVSVEMNLVEEAYQALKKAVTLDPNNAYYNYAMGAVASQREEAGEAIPYFQKYCQLKALDPRGRLALGAAYFASRDDDNAETVIAAIAGNPETAAVAHYYLGRIANHKSNYREAIAQLGMALKVRPNYAEAYAERGLVYLKQKNYPEAQNDLRKALEINPDNYTASLNLMILYQRTDDPRADAQAKRFEQVRQKRAERAKEFLRTIEVIP